MGILDRLFGSGDIVRILRLFVSNPEAIISIEAVTKRTRVKRDTARAEIKMLEETVALKIDYRDARFQLAKVYLEVGDNVKAKEQADFILTRLGNDEEVRTWLTENNL